jgi:hypothetical protein
MDKEVARIWASLDDMAQNNPKVSFFDVGISRIYFQVEEGSDNKFPDYQARFLYSSIRK